MKYASVFLIVALVFVSAAEAQQKHPTATLNKVSTEDGLTLGSGVSLDTIAPAYPSPFKKINVYREKNPNPLGHVKIYVATTSNAVDSAMGVNVEAKASYLFASGKAKLEFDRASSISEETFRLVIVGESKYGDDVLREPELRPEAAELIKNGKMDEFSQRYGTHYVHREHRIAKIVLTVSVDRWSANTVQKVRSEVGGSVDFVLGGGELNASIRNDLKEAAKRNTLNVELFTVGGTGLKGFGDFVKSLLSESGDFQARVGDALALVLKDFTADNSGIGAVTVASYREFGWDSKVPLWNDFFEQKLKKCFELYSAGRRAEDNIRRFAIPNADAPSKKKKLEGYAGQYDDYLTQLADFQKGLLDKDQTFINKQFPKKPEIDPKTFEDILEQFRTLESRVKQLERQTSRADERAVIFVCNAKKEKGDIEGLINEPLVHRERFPTKVKMAWVARTSTNKLLVTASVDPKDPFAVIITVIAHQYGIRETLNILVQREIDPK